MVCGSCIPTSPISGYRVMLVFGMVMMAGMLTSSFMMYVSGVVLYRLPLPLPMPSQLYPGDLAVLLVGITFLAMNGSQFTRICTSFLLPDALSWKGPLLRSLDLVQNCLALLLGIAGTAPGLLLVYSTPHLQGRPAFATALVWSSIVASAVAPWMAVWHKSRRDAVLSAIQDSRSMTPEGDSKMEADEDLRSIPDAAKRAERSKHRIAVYRRASQMDLFSSAGWLAIVSFGVMVSVAAVQVAVGADSPLLGSIQKAIQLLVGQVGPANAPLGWRASRAWSMVGTALLQSFMRR